VPQPRAQGGLGWRPSLPDYRDAAYRFGTALKAELIAPAELPPSAQPQRRELDKLPVLDQGMCSGCTGFGTALMDAVERNVTLRSPLFIYYEARRLIGETGVDNGAYGRDAVKVCASLGAPTLNLWPTHVDPAGNVLNVFDDPADKADRDAAKRKAFSYHPVANAQEFRSCLAGGHLFAIGITCYSNLFAEAVDNRGVVPMPAGQDEGGHWVPIIGYDDKFRESQWAQEARNAGLPDSAIPERVYEFQNSWSEQWGRHGRGVLHAEYVESPYLADDGQTIRGFARDDR
jgi:hypothetical protein